MRFCQLQDRTDRDQPGFLVFDRDAKLMAVGYSRAKGNHVNVMALADFSVSVMTLVSSTAAR